MTTFKYCGSELDLFAQATNWKAYWSKLVRPYLGARILEVGAGIGATTRVFRDAPTSRWVALEPDETLAHRLEAQRRAGDIPARIEIVVGDSSSLQPSDQFDTILYMDVLA